MMKNLSEKGLAHIILLVILIAGLIAGLYLIQHPQIFKPRANVNGPSAQFVDASGNAISQTTTANVRLKIVKNSGGSTVGTAADVPLPTSTPTAAADRVPAPTISPTLLYTNASQAQTFLKAQGYPDAVVTSSSVGQYTAVVSGQTTNFTAPASGGTLVGLKQLIDNATGTHPMVSAYTRGLTAPAELVNLLKAQQSFVTGITIPDGAAGYNVSTTDRGTIFVPHSAMIDSNGYSYWAINDISNYLNMHPHGE